MPTKPLDRLMFAQGGLCFFCGLPLPKDEASVEHLVPLSRAGSNNDENCVACCKTISMLLGSMSLKEKIRVVLNQGGKFVCPNGAGASTLEQSPKVSPVASAAGTQTVVPASKPKIDNYAVVLADLKKRGTSRPRKVETLKSTIRATVKNAKGTLTEAQLETLFRHLQINGKVIVEGEKVGYSL